MSDAAKKIIEAIDALPDAERQEVIRELLRRAAVVDLGFPSDGELVGAADDVFQDLDRREGRE